jgi:hypothetical protein
VQPFVFTEFREFVAVAMPPAASAALDAEPSTPDPRAPERLIAQVARVADVAGSSGDDVLRRFGAHLFGRFAALYPVFFVDADSAVDVLARLDTAVHAEVQKLYPDAEFPAFTSQRLPDGGVAMRYRSTRPFAALAEGLIRGCVAHFGAPLAVRCTASDPDGRSAEFEVRPHPTRVAAG